MDTILHRFKLFFYEQVDPLVVSQKLYKSRRIDSKQNKTVLSLVRGSSNRQETWDYLLPIIQSQCSYACLLEVLLNCGYVEIFINIVVQFVLNNPLNLKMHKSTVLNSSSRSSQELLMKLKIETHNIQHKNPRKYLHWKKEQYKSDFLNEKDETDKLKKADIYAASLCAEIDSYTILYERKFPSHGLFQELQSVIPHTSNTHVTQVAYDTRLALAYSIADQEDKCEDHLRNAMASSIQIGYCVELVEMLYIYVFNLIGIHENYPHKRLFDKIMHMAEYCLLCLQEETEDFISLFWKRRIYLRIIFCLLGISNRGDVIPGRAVVSQYVRKANDLMVEMDKIWQGFETRRLMFYYVAKARIAEIEDEFEFSIECLNMAVDFGRDGGFGEEVYIKGFLNSLKHKHSQQQVSDEDKKKYTVTRVPVENVETSTNEDETSQKWLSTIFNEKIDTFSEDYNEYIINDDTSGNEKGEETTLKQIGRAHV